MAGPNLLPPIHELRFETASEHVSKRVPVLPPSATVAELVIRGLSVGVPLTRVLGRELLRDCSSAW